MGINTMARFIYVNPTGYPIEQLPREWHGISPFTEAQAVAHRWRKVWLPDPEPVKEPVTKCTKYDLVKCLREHFPEYLEKLKDAYGKNSHVAFFWNTVNDLDRNNAEFIELAHAIGFDDTQIDEVFSLVIPTEGLK